MGRAVDLYVMGAAMRSLRGSVVRHEGSDLWVEVEDGRLEAGEAVCLQTSTSAPWLYGKVIGTETLGTRVHIDGTHTPDRREFSRVWGPLHLRYQVSSEQGFELASLRWLRNAQGVGSQWRRPPMFMDFSGSGVRFESRGKSELRAGDSLLIGVRIPGDDVEHRVTAKVVRLLEQGTQVAIQFVNCSEGAVSALVEFAERIQEQLVELLGESDAREPTLTD